MSAGIVGRFLIRASVCLVSVGAVLGGASFVWQQATPSSNEHRISATHGTKRQIRDLRRALVQTRQALSKERKLTGQLSRELQDTSHQIDELSRAVDKFRALLRGKNVSVPVANAGKREHAGQNSLNGWRFASSRRADEDHAHVAQERATRSAVRALPDTARQRVQTIQPERYGLQAEIDMRSRLAPLAAVAPPPAVASFGVPRAYEASRTSGYAAD